MTISLRVRLVVGIVLTLGIASFATIFVGVWVFENGVTEQALSKTQHDMASARVIYNAAMADLGARVRITASSSQVRQALSQGDGDSFATELERIRQREGLDVLDLLDNEGRVVVRAQNAASRGDSMAADPVVKRVLSGSALVLATAAVSPEALRRESEELARRARVSLVGGKGESGSGGVVAEGLAMQAAAMVSGDDGRRLGVLVGWKLLNHDITVVDTIKRTIYQGEVYRGREVGEGTLCLGDVRVATNAEIDERRAVGSRVDPAVRERVLQQGQVRIDRAEVLGETHLTAYEPIKDIDGHIVGILCLGIPAARYTDVGRQAVTIFLVISACAMLLGFVISGVVAKSITGPIRRLVHTVDGLAGGDFDRRWEPSNGVAEIELLGTRFNQMADAIRARDVQLRHRTEQQIGRSERLAMIGRLAAGVAHEINNPLGGIMLFSNILLRKAPKEGLERENLQRILNETKRCQKIVQGLLDFSRHKEPKVEPVPARDVVEKSLALVRDQSLFLNIKIETRHDDSPPIMADVAQLQQVFVNTIINAAEAMEGRGRLTITSKPSEDPGFVEICVADTGCGMTPEQLGKLFEPFFTTKEVGKGTGLGLSISRSIIENHGGSIWAESKLGEGTKMFMRLPTKKEPS